MGRSTVNLPLALPVLAAVASACSEDSAPGQQLLVPDGVRLHWDERFNGTNDGLGALVPLDVMVYEGDTGEPQAHVELHVEAGYSGVVVPLDVDLVEPVEPCDDCLFLWDAHRDRYVDLVPDDASQTAVLHTDHDGLALVYLYVDDFPGEGDLQPFTVTVETSLDSEQFEVFPD